MLGKEISVEEAADKFMSKNEEVARHVISNVVELLVRKEIDPKK